MSHMSAHCGCLLDRRHSFSSGKQSCCMVHTCTGQSHQILLGRFYMGAKKPRLQGDEHMAVMDELCDAVKSKWPNALLQFEDFQTDRAFDMLDRYRHRQLCFNDDIQGTGAVVTTGWVPGRVPLLVSGQPQAFCSLAVPQFSKSVATVALLTASWVILMH